MKITDFWDVTTCSVVDRYQHLEHPDLIFINERFNLPSSRVLQNLHTYYKTTRCHILEDQNLNTNLDLNLSSNYSIINDLQ
jgi:hypothetical protein